MRKFFATKMKGSGKRQFKLYFSLFAVLFSCLMVLGSTYAWFTSADKVTNAFEGSRFQVDLQEAFKPNFNWQPGKDTTKQIRVQNSGQTPALVRLSLFEYLLTFQVDVTDQTGNGNLKTVSASTSPIVDSKNPETWVAAAANKGTYESAGKFYVAGAAVFSDQTNGAGRYRLNDSSRENNLLANFVLNFSSTFYTTPPPAGTAGYWLYEDGYFYYSDLLEPGAVSNPLLESVHLAVSAPNPLKGALYQLNPHLEAHDATKIIKNEWGFTADGSVDEMYQLYLK